jgi:hypothetical protein
MSRGTLPLFCLLLVGCQVHPVPSNIIRLHELARHDFQKAHPLVQPGDIVFRLGSTKLLNGVLDFSVIVADMSESDFSHACIVVEEHDFMIVDVTAYGIERRYFKDWHVTGSKNIVIRRLKPEYQFLVPIVLNTLNELVEKDVLYDKDFIFGDDKFYCTELVDHVFRINGYPLADPIRLEDLPRYTWYYAFGCRVAGIDSDRKVIVAGNDKIGLFSSNMLYTVVDLREGAEPLPKTPMMLASGTGDADKQADRQPSDNR